MTNNNIPELEIEVETIKKGARVYRAINHRLRQSIMHNLHRQGRMTVTELYTMLDIEQSVTSQHLAILRDQDLLVAERAGKFIYYSINYGRLDFLQDLTKAFLTGNEQGK